MSRAVEAGQAKGRPPPRPDRIAPCTDCGAKVALGDSGGAPGIGACRRRQGLLLRIIRMRDLRDLRGGRQARRRGY